MRDDDLETRILDFERVCRLEGPPDFSPFLDRPPALDGEERRRLLVELICIDLEFRWQGDPPSQNRRQPPRLESYAASYPEFGSFDQLPLEIIGQEYRVRCQWGDRPTHSDFLSRFRARQDEIRPELAQIDAELRDELANSRFAPACAAGLIAPEAKADPDLGVPWLSHQDILLRRMIGSGRMGKVYEAWQRSSSRLVAVKFLRKSLLHQFGVVQRFVGEARIIARLRHPNIVRVHGLGRTPGGAYFIVMEQIDGSSLEAIRDKGLVAISEAIHWGMETCHALEHAHATGIVHCDLKPANLLLGRDGKLRVTDFGLSRSLTEHTPWTAEVEGTAPYMAPEQISRCWGRIDVRTDVYGVGAVLFTLLTGRPPWVGRRLPDVLAQVISAAPAIPLASLRPDAPQSVSELCRRCLSKTPEARYQSMREVRSALSEIAQRLDGHVPVHGRGLPPQDDHASD